MESVTFDGNVLSDKYRVLVRRELPFQTARDESAPGRDGTHVRGAEYTPQAVTLVFVLGPCGNVEMMRRIRGLMADLDVREPKRLELGEDGGLWCMAMPSGKREWKRHVSTCSVEVPFIVEDAALYGRSMSVTVPSGGSVEFNVNGTYQTAPAITANAVRDASSNVWGLRLDDGDFVHVETGTASAALTKIDCGERTVNVAGAVKVPTLDSDWLELAPGHHRLAMDNGTGAATVTWIERWL